MANRWEQRAVSVVVPRALALAMWERARQWDVDAGGRFDVRAAAIVIWSGQLGEHGRDSEPVGTVYIRWNDPAPDQATIWRLEWDPRRGGSEADVWRALELLAGQPLEPYGM